MRRIHELLDILLHVDSLPLLVAVLERRRSLLGVVDRRPDDVNSLIMHGTRRRLIVRQFYFLLFNHGSVLLLLKLILLLYHADMLFKLISQLLFLLLLFQN